MAKKRLLIIEDDTDVSEMLFVYFTGQGYEVLHALNGTDGLMLARSKFPNLTLLDVMLPDMDGFEVAKSLRTTTITKFIPIIFLTQRDGRSDKVAGLELGADDYITKPFDIEELRLRVQGSLRRSSRETLQDARTGLPTGALIEEMSRTVDGKTGWVRLDVQLNGLSAFRDVYGFMAADEALAFAAQSLLGAVGARGTVEDFVGSASEDRFVLFTQAADLPALTETIQTGFSEGVRKLYNFTDSERGFVLVKDGEDERPEPLMRFAVTPTPAPATESVKA